MKKALKYLKIMTLALLCVVAFGTVKAEAAQVPEKVTGLTQTDATKTALEVEWALSEMATDYEAYISSDKINWTMTDSWNNSNCFYGLTPGTTYYVKVRAYVEEFNEVTYEDEYTYGEFSDVLECVTAPQSAVTNLKKDKSTTTSVSLSWTGVQGASGYYVNYEAYSPVNEEKQVVSTGTSITLSGLQKDARYYVYITPYRATSDGKFVAMGDTSSSLQATVTPSKVKTIDISYFASSSKMSIGVEDKQEADGYQIEVWTSYGKKAKKIVSKDSQYGYEYIKNKAFKKANMFKVRARAYIKDNGKKTYGAWSSWKYVSKDIDITKLKSTKKGVKVTWEKLNGADRYVVYASTKQQSGYKKVKTINKGSITSCTVSKIGKTKLKSGKTYYFYVVPYEKVNGKYYQSSEPTFCYKIKYKK